MPFTEDRGIIIRINTTIDLAGASATIAKVKKPSGNTFWTCTVYDEVSGILEHITSTTANELDDIGTWSVQAKITFASGEIYHGTIATFTVADILVPTP